MQSAKHFLLRNLHAAHGEFEKLEEAIFFFFFFPFYQQKLNNIYGEFLVIKGSRNKIIHHLMAYNDEILICYFQLFGCINI